MRGDDVVLLKNDAGGILGGISNGQPIVFRLAFKPTPSIARPQSTVNLRTGEDTIIHVEGRHDPCIVPRALPAVEAAASVVIADLVNRCNYIPDSMHRDSDKVLFSDRNHSL
jgi:chorismate synthase